MRGVLGDDYTVKLRKAYHPLVTGGSDLVCFWFTRSLQQVLTGHTLRVGLVSTNSIRGGSNRGILDRIVTDCSIDVAWSDEPWALNGASVRVSIISFSQKLAGQAWLDGKSVGKIFSDLTAGDVDLTLARRLPENERIAFNGIQKTGPFEVSGEQARRWLALPSNANGRPNSDVLRPYWNGIDVTRRNRDSWIVDFGAERDESEAGFYSAPFSYVFTAVRPIRQANSLEPLRRLWWRHWRPRVDMHNAISVLKRFIVTPEVAKHRVFAWVPLAVGADKNLIVIAKDDDTTFGILQSRFHEIWALKLGTSLGVENDPRYTPSTTFETFPFPEGLAPRTAADLIDGDPRARFIAEAAQKLVSARDLWLNPPELVVSLPEVVPGFPDRLVPKNDAAAAILRKRTLTALYNMRGTPEGAWLDGLHATLDAAVAAAYGWPGDLPDEEILSRLLALNHQRAAKRSSEDGKSSARSTARRDDRRS